MEVLVQLECGTVYCTVVGGEVTAARQTLRLCVSAVSLAQYRDKGKVSSELEFTESLNLR